jgi:hypothetical protein
MAKLKLVLFVMVLLQLYPLQFSRAESAKDFKESFKGLKECMVKINAYSNELGFGILNEKTLAFLSQDDICLIIDSGALICFAQPHYPTCGNQGPHGENGLCESVNVEAPLGFRSRLQFSLQPPYGHVPRLVEI